MAIFCVFDDDVDDDEKGDGQEKLDDGDEDHDDRVIASKSHA